MIDHDKYSNDRHIFNETINSEETELLEMNIDNKLKFAHEL